jgi:cytochrome c peroxidase
MKIKALKLLALACLLAAIALPVLFLSGTTSSEPDPSLVGLGHGNLETFNANYKDWETQYEKDGGDRNMVLAMGWFKGLSTGHSYASGLAKFNLVDGTVTVAINGLPKDEGWDVWMVDSAPGRSIGLENDDNMLRIGSLNHDDKVSTLALSLGKDAFTTFNMDLIIVTKAGNSPIEDRTLIGTTSLFHRMYRSKQQGQFGVLADADPIQQPAPDNRGFLRRIVDAISPTASAQIGPIPNPSTPLQQSITRGRQSFFNETFNGNGRTCGTCHRENGNLTIDAEFIDDLPPNDPIFVAEFVPALANNFENPILMRKLGLILENADGFGNLASNFVMRGVPHTLALLQNTLTPVAGGGDGTTTPPNERTGWGGDGAPGTGTLREFIIGAIIQHYPKTLNRQAPGDFRMPTTGELDDLEAFQKSLGRRADLDLAAMQPKFKNEVVRKGVDIFNNGGSVLGGSNAGAGKCFFCHLNAGASDFFFPGQNANFNTNVEGLPSQPADLVLPLQLNPQDGGFGQTGISPTGGIGNGSFNTPVLVEAADTGPFFHNNSIETIEGAVDFYNSTAFNQSPGFGSLIGGIKLEATEVVAVAALLRVINVLENERSARDLINRIKVSNSQSQASILADLAIAEIDDAIEVLVGGGLHRKAQKEFNKARRNTRMAGDAPNANQRISEANQALNFLTTAKNDIIDP